MKAKVQRWGNSLASGSPVPGEGARVHTSRRSRCGGPGQDRIEPCVRPDPGGTARGGDAAEQHTGLDWRPRAGSRPGEMKSWRPWTPACGDIVWVRTRRNAAAGPVRRRRVQRQGGARPRVSDRQRAKGYPFEVRCRLDCVAESSSRTGSRVSTGGRAASAGRHGSRRGGHAVREGSCRCSRSDGAGPARRPRILAPSGPPARRLPAASRRRGGRRGAPDAAPRRRCPRASAGTRRRCSATASPCRSGSSRSG